jgi:WD40 repeat protein
MEPAQTINEAYYLKQILELKDEIIKLQRELLEKDKIIIQDKERIFELEKKLNEKYNKPISSSTQNKITPKDNFNFNITEKEPIFKMDDLKSCYYTIYILQDGRIAAGGDSCSIIIYNKETFKSEMTIKEHSEYIMYLTQLKSGYLISLGNDAYINIYNLLENNKYLVMQKIKAHQARIHKLREFDDDRFMTCSDDCTIKFFFKNKNKNEYLEDYTFKDDIYIVDILRTKEGEIAYSGYNNNGTSFVRFYDLKSRKKIDSSSVTTFYNGLSDFLYKLSETYLLVGASNSILIFDVNQHRQIREIKQDNSNCFTSFVKIDASILLSSDCTGKIRQWIIDDDNLILKSTKENAHGGQIMMIRKNQDGLIITCSDDATIKIWG